MKFEQFKKQTFDFIKLNGFNKLTRIQDATIDMALRDKDVIALSKTGTGKTHAFLIPIMEKIDSSKDELQVIISVPTRELAYQLYEKAKMMCDIDSYIRIKVSVGGQDKKRSLDSFKTVPHIIIGTPGRLKDLFIESAIRIDTVKIFVVDEADMTLEYGFLTDLDVLFSRIAKPQILCFSATFPEGLKPFVKKYLNNPQMIKIEDNAYMNPKIKHYLVNAKHHSYGECLLNVLPSFQPYVCMIFANTRNEVVEVAELLRQNNYDVLELHGGLESRARKQAIKALAARTYTYVVCSDVAGRGLDNEGITHVVSLGIPSDISFFTHRIGRTGRAGNDGTCFTIYKEADIPSLKILAQTIKFEPRNYRKGGFFKELKHLTFEAINKTDKREKEIAKSLSRKKEKVKPNYKKKKAQLVKKIKQKERQEYIRGKIREEKKARYKAKAHELYQSLKEKK